MRSTPNEAADTPDVATDPGTVSDVTRDPGVQDALRQAGAGTHEVPRHHRTTALVVVAVFGLAFIALRLALGMHAFGLSPAANALIARIALGIAAIGAVLGVSWALDRYVIARVADPIYRFNLERVRKLGSFLAVSFVVVSVVFVSWYTALLSLGLISLVLGFALQTPITSFIGWIYILVRQPYRIGDRIRIGDVHGDVIDVGYLDTTLWEFGSEFLVTEHPSGRIVKFPNSSVLNSPVFNYSWPLFPYIWNEVKVQVAYDSDLAFVAETMQGTVESEIGDGMAAKVAVYRDLVARTPIGRLDVNDRPSVQFRVSENTWIEAIVRYLVTPREAPAMRARVTRLVIERLNAEPDRTRFPKSDSR